MSLGLFSLGLGLSRSHHHGNKENSGETANAGGYEEALLAVSRVVAYCPCLGFGV